MSTCLPCALYRQHLKTKLSVLSTHRNITFHPLIYSSQTALELRATSPGTFGRRRQHVCASNRSRRCYTTALVQTTETGVSHSSLCSPHTLTLLHKTKSFLPRVLPPEELVEDPVDSFEFWDSLINGVYRDLSSGDLNGKNVQVTIHGIDDFAGSKEFVTALLEVPFASDEVQNNALRDRWKDRPPAVKSITIVQTIQSRMTTDPSTEVVHTSSPWFQRFQIPLQITELSPVPFPTTFTEQRDTLHSVFEADIPVIVCNPLVTPVTSIPFNRLPFNNPSAIFILTCAPTSASSLEAQILKQFQTPTSLPRNVPRGTAKILLVDPECALIALRILQSAPSSSSAIQRFQDNFLRSEISTFTETIADMLLPSGPGSPLVDIQSKVRKIRTRTATAHLYGAFAACQRALQRAVDEINVVCAGVSELRAQVEEAKEKAQGEVFGFGNPVGDKTGLDEVGSALDDAKRKMKPVMECLTWWKMVWRVDDISGIVGSATERAWCKNLEQKLILQTGRLSIHQQVLASRAFDFYRSISSSPSSSFRSPLLFNHIQQLASSPSYLVGQNLNTLTQAIHNRRSQILTYPTTRLHLAAQRSTILSASSIVVGAGIASLSPIATQFVGIASELEISTAVGLGALVAVGGIRLAVGWWEKAKKRWWEDWHRVGEGLDRGLKATLDQTMNEKVTIVAQRVAEGLTEQAEKRRKEVGELQDEITTLLEELKNRDAGV